MGAYLSEPVRTKVPADSRDDRLEYGASSMQGWRISQEDTHNCLLNFDKDTTFFAVYDGHGGAEVAQYTAEHLPDFLKALDSYKDARLTEALEQAFLEFDGTLKKDDIQQTLKELAGLDTDEGSDHDEEQEAAKLFEEADMPLDQLLLRYKSGGAAPPTKDIRKLSKSEKFQSPMIRSKKEEGQLKAEDKDDVKQKLDDQLVNGHNSASQSAAVPDSTGGSTNEGKAASSSPEPSKSASNKSEDVTCSSDSGISVSTSNTHQADSGGGSSAVTSSECAGSVAGGAAASSGSGSQEPSSSSGRSRKKKSGVIPAEGEDESSFDEDEEDTEDEEDSDEDGEKQQWWSDDSDSEDSEDGEGPFDGEEEEEDGETSEVNTGGEEPGYDSGCTAVVSVLRGNDLYVANAGDSRCVLCRAGKAVDLSEDHKPEDTPERERITKAGGRITLDGRVNGGLNLSRAIGDHRYKMREDLLDREQMITALPDIRQITLQNDDEFLVLACDGIWNAMSSQDVVTFVRERIQAGVHPLSDICGEMFELCLAPDTKGDGMGCDNMTCIIVNFHPKPQDASVTDEKCASSGTKITQSSSDDKVTESSEASVKVPSKSSLLESSEADAAVDSTASDDSSGTKRKAEEELIDSSESKKTRIDDADSSG